MDYLQARPIGRGSRVMEIGCGWGPAAVYCASRYKARVTGLDVDAEVFPFLEIMAELNKVTVEQRVSRFEKLSGKELGGYDTIIGTDICFWDSLVDPLYRLVNRALANGTGRVILTDPGRPTFYEFVDRCSKRFKVKLQEWYAVEPERFEGEVVEIRSK
jgi:predicted nicotinamide N-methyase